MDEAVPLDPAPRRSRAGPFILIVALAFVIGLALMWMAARDGGGWWAPATPPAAAPAATTVPTAPPATGATDPLTLATREAALAAQLAALEARTAAIGVDVTTAADRAGRAEAILIAFAARRAIERGSPLGYLEEQLSRRFGATQQTAVDAVVQAGREPVTIESLRQALDANAALLLNPGSQGWFGGLITELRSLVVLHDANTPSPLPSDRLARARRRLDAGQVDAALEEIRRLPGGAQVSKWTTDAQRYLAAHRGLDTLETAAIVGTIPALPQPTLPASPAVEGTAEQAESEATGA